MTDDEIKQNHRVRESKNAEESLHKSPEDLLKEIFTVATDHKFQGQVTSTNRTIAYFSSLLVILSRQAEESTKEITKLTRTLTRLTWVIAILTFFLVITIFFDIPKISLNRQSKTNRAIEQNHTSNKNHKGNDVSNNIR